MRYLFLFLFLFSAHSASAWVIISQAGGAWRVAEDQTSPDESSALTCPDAKAPDAPDDEGQNTEEEEDTQ